MDEMIFVPCRKHEHGLIGSVLHEHDWQHLNLPFLVDEPPPNDVERMSINEWFCSMWATRLKTDVEPVIITSRIYEEEEGKNE